MSQGASMERAIANAHFLFNVSGVALFIGLVPWIEKFLDQLLPDRPNEFPNET
jgi:Na+/phosphate symporter